MIDEERQRLCKDLRTFHDPLISKDWIAHKCNIAADEIERLQRELKMTLGLLYQESERRANAEHELKLWKEQG